MNPAEFTSTYYIDRRGRTPAMGRPAFKNLIALTYCLYGWPIWTLCLLNVFKRLFVTM